LLRCDPSLRSPICRCARRRQSRRADFCGAAAYTTDVTRCFLSLVRSWRAHSLENLYRESLCSPTDVCRELYDQRGLTLSALERNSALLTLLDQRGDQRMIFASAAALLTQPTYSHAIPHTRAFLYEPPALTSMLRLSEILTRPVCLMRRELRDGRRRLLEDLPPCRQTTFSSRRPQRCDPSPSRAPFSPCAPPTRLPFASRTPSHLNFSCHSLHILPRSPPCILPRNLLCILPRIPPCLTP
jgi:hypothetical protein